MARRKHAAKPVDDTQTDTVVESIEPAQNPKVTRSKVKDKKKDQTEPTNTRMNCYKNIWRVIKALVIIMFIPPFLNYVALRRETNELTPEGERYDIGWGQKLQVTCKGKGAPTVILEAPTGYSSDVWSFVVPLLAKHSQVCTYDRAGLGFSDRPHENYTSANEIAGNKPKWEPFTVERMVEDMRRLFTLSSQPQKPFILVGSEIGALVSQFYAQLYSEDVAGMVLINPLGQDLFEQESDVWINYWFRHLVPSFQTQQLGAAIGVTRIALMLGLASQPLQKVELDDMIVNRQKHLLCHPRHLSSVVDEHFFINDTFSQMRSVRLLRSPPNIPVMVMTGNYYDEQLPADLNKAWAKTEQNMLSRRLRHAQHVVVSGGDRHMIYRKPITVAQHIIKMVKQFQTGET